MKRALLLLLHAERKIIQKTLFHHYQMYVPIFVGFFNELIHEI